MNDLAPARAQGAQTAVWPRASLVAIVLVGALVRLWVINWRDPWTPHHPDEHIPALEAMALWEGVTPQEIGWPASTTRLLLSALEAGECLFQQRHALWQQRDAPDRALGVVTNWIGSRYVDQKALYQTGRFLSVLTGILQLIAVAWALRQWVGLSGAAIGTLAAALSPIAVEYSQYVLADITGLLFATLVIGLAAHPTRSRVLAMAALASLAAASKVHYGLWLLTPIVCIWLRKADDEGRKMLLTLGAIGIAVWVFVTLVPWLWVNPLLALKEFVATVAAKVGTGSSWQLLPHNIVLIFGRLGALSLVGAVAGLAAIGKDRWRPLWPIVIPLVVGTIVLGLSRIVFERYGLVLLPGLLVLAGFAGDRWLGPNRPRTWPLAAIVLAGCLIVTTVTLWRSQRIAGETDVDVLATQWVMANVRSGSRVAVWQESNAFIPRTEAQLRGCSEQSEGRAAYLEKWRVNGVNDPDGVDAQSMRAAVLNDEIFHAYWCRRELQARKDPGYFVIRYHTQPRFEAFLEKDVTNEFRTGQHGVTGGVDVLVINRQIDVGIPPAQVLETRRGQRVIYVR